MKKQNEKIKENQKVKKCRLKGKKGITLIALVVTIIVLLILAGISIQMITGQSGILQQAETARIKTAHAEVYEALNLKAGEYLTGKYTQGYTKSLIDYFLNEKEYIYTMEEIDGYIVNVEKLLGGKSSYGKGTDGKTDVYKLEETKKEEIGKVATNIPIKIAETNTQKIYNVVYYGKTIEDKAELGSIIDVVETNSNEITFYIESEGSPELKGTYHALRDMSWEEFIESEYNTFGLKLDKRLSFVDGSCAVCVDDGRRLFNKGGDDNGNVVISKNKIINEKTYVVSWWEE